MSPSRKALFPTPHHMTQSEASDFLKRQILEDALDAKWLEPCVRKPGGKGCTVLYRFADVNDVSLRIAAGEYPTPDPELVKEKARAKAAARKKGALQAA